MRNFITDQGVYVLYIESRDRGYDVRLEDKHGRTVSKEAPRRRFERAFQTENSGGNLHPEFEIVSKNLFCNKGTQSEGHRAE